MKNAHGNAYYLRPDEPTLSSLRSHLIAFGRFPKWRSDFSSETVHYICSDRRSTRWLGAKLTCFETEKVYDFRISDADTGGERILFVVIDQ